MSLTSFSKPSRRDVLRQLALAVTAAGANSFNIEAAKVVHELAVEAREQSGNYVPKAFTDHQFPAPLQDGFPTNSNRYSHRRCCQKQKHSFRSSAE